MSNVELIPALLVVVPIVAATVPILLGLRFDRTGWSVAALTCTGLFAGAVALALEVYAGADGSPVVHVFGNYEPPYGIEFVVDELSAVIVLLVTAVALGVLVYTRVGGPRGNAFYTGYLLLTAGLLGLAMTGDAFNLFVFLEITGLGTYALVASGDGPESAVASLKYLVIGTIGASLYLIGVGLLFMATGTLNMVDLAAQLEVAERQTLVRAGFAFVFVGLSIKVAQWPLHSWQPDAYQHAPDGVTPLIAALVSTVSAYALGRLLFGVFGVDFLLETLFAREVIVTVGSVSVLAGSTLAVVQRDVKRMLAYSSVSQFGLIVAAYGLATETALVGAIYHLIGHGLLKAGLFLCVGVIGLSYGARTVDEYAGLARRRPIPAAAMAVMLVALVGIPPSVGFVGKWYIALGAVEAQVWPVAAVIFLSTMLTLAYAARLLEKMYFTPTVVELPTAPGAVATDGGAESGTPGATPGMLALLVVIALLAVGLGFAGGAFAELLDPFVSEVFADV